MQLPLALLPILALLPSVAAHGYVKKVVIDGTTYTGPLPADSAGEANNSPSPIRQIADIGPVKGATNPDINCGLSAQLASLVVPANPGSSLAFYWGNPSGGNWPHEVGPLMTYMASCDTTTCDKFNGSTAKWFKIDQIGQKSGGTWYQQDVANGNPVTLAIPTQVAPGDYLIRHEIISLQNGGSPGGAEFYPSCTQVRVGGSQTGTPDQTVSFPGAYSDTDPGIDDPNVYDPGSPYTFPGPPVSNLASPSDMSTSNGGQDNGSQSSSTTPGKMTTTSSKSTTSSTTMYGVYAQSTQSGVDPTQTDVDPTQTSVDPTESGVDPTQTGADPTQSGVYPTQSDVDPTPASVDSTQSGDQPAPSGVRHTRSGVRPTQSGGEPTQPGGGPTESGYEPTQSGTQYGDQPTPSDTRHTQSGAGPAQSGGRTRSGSRPTRSGGRPTQSGFEPSQSGVEPTPSGDQPTPSDAQPTQPGGEPTQSSDQPMETSPADCGSERRDASRARQNNRAQRKRRAHPMRGLRRARHP